MDKIKPIASQEVFSGVQIKVVATVVGGLLEEVLNDYIGDLQLEIGCRSTVR